MPGVQRKWIMYKTRINSIIYKMKLCNTNPTNSPCKDESGIVGGRTRGRALLFLCIGCGFAGVVETCGSNSHEETLSGCKIDNCSSHCTCNRIKIGHKIIEPKANV